MADQNSKVVLEIEVNDSGVVESARRTRKAYEDVNRHQVRGLKQQKENIRDVTKMKSKTESPQAFRKMLDAGRKRLQTEKETLRVMKQQEAVAARMMRSGGVGAGPLDLFGRQTGAGGFGGGLSGLMGMRSGKAGRGIGRGVGGMLGGMGRGGMLALARMLGPLGFLASGVGAVGSFAAGATAAKIRAGHSLNMQQQRALVGLAGGGTSRAAIDRAKLLGAGYGYGPIDTISQARAAALQTGNARSVSTAQAYSRATMMDIGQTTNVMGSIARGGAGFTGTSTGAGEKAMERTWANIFRTGLDRSRFAESFAGAGRLIDQISGLTGGRVNARGIADQLGDLGSTGAAGLIGQRGANVLMQLHNAIRAPGGGEAGQALTLQAFGFGKPGGGASYYEAMRRQQLGIGDPRNLRDLWSETAGQSGGKKEQLLMLNRMTGITLPVLEEVDKAMRKTAGMTPEQRDEEIEKIMKANASVEEKALEETSKMAELMQQMVEHELDTLRAGELTSKTLLNIQETTNHLVRTLLPLAQKLLGIVDEVYRFLVNIWGGDEDKKKYKESKEREIKDAYYSGEISKEEAERQLAEAGVWNKWSRGNRAGTKVSPLGDTEISPKARAFMEMISPTRSAAGKPVSAEFDPMAFSGYMDVATPEMRKAISDYQKNMYEAKNTPSTKDDAEVLRRFLDQFGPQLNKMMAGIELMAGSVGDFARESAATSSVPGRDVPPTGQPTDWVQQTSGN